jgi:hypothetical protein
MKKFTKKHISLFSLGAGIGHHHHFSLHDFSFSLRWADAVLSVSREGEFDLSRVVPGVVKQIKTGDEEGSCGRRKL